MHFLDSISQSNLDIRLLWFSVFIRMISFGFTNQVLTLYLNRLGISEYKIGIFMTLVMIGDTLLSFLLTWYSHRIGSRRVMISGALLMCLSGFVFGTGTDSYALLLGSAVVGVISPSGDETGPFKSIEEAIIAKLTPPNHRAEIYAVHFLLSAAGAALGSLLCGAIVQFLLDSRGLEYREAYRSVFVIYTLLGGLKFISMLFLSDKCERSYVPQYASVKPSASNDDLRNPTSHSSNNSSSNDILSNSLINSSSNNSSGGNAITTRSGIQDGEDLGDFNSISSQSTTLDERRPLISSVVVHDTVTGLSNETQTLLFKLLISFMLDSFGYGFMPGAWQVYYFKMVFVVSPIVLGTIFFTTSLCQTVSAVPSAYFANYFGPIRAAIVTQIPTAIFCMSIPFFGALNLFWPSVLSLILQNSFSSMDVVPRQVLLTELITNHDELPRVLGVVNIGKTLARTFGPVATGKLAENNMLWVAFQVAGSCLILSNLILYGNFRGVDEHVLSKRNLHYDIE